MGSLAAVELDIVSCALPKHRGHCEIASNGQVIPYSQIHHMYNTVPYYPDHSGAQKGNGVLKWYVGTESDFVDPLFFHACKLNRRLLVERTRQDLCAGLPYRTTTVSRTSKLKALVVR